MKIAHAHIDFRKVFGQVLGHLFCQRGYQHSLFALCAKPALAELSGAIRRSPPAYRAAGNRAVSVAAHRVSCRSDGANNSRPRGRSPSLSASPYRTSFVDADVALRVISLLRSASAPTIRAPG